MTESAQSLGSRPSWVVPASWRRRHALAMSGRLWPVVLPGIALGLAGTSVALATALVPSAATLLAVVFLGGICLVGLVAAAWTRRADWWLATLVVVLAMFPNSEIIWDLRIVSGGFRIFTRSVLGVVSIWDILLLILLVLALWTHPRGARKSRGFGRSADVFLLGVAAVCGAGLVNGLIHAWVVTYGPTSFRSVVQQGLPILYLLASILVGRRAIRGPTSIWRIIWAVRLSTVAVLVQGTLLFVLSLRGAFPAMRGFLGIPMVLYDQLTVLTVAMCLMVARNVAGQKLKFGDWVMLAGSILFLLLSTRRLVLVLVVVNLCLVFVLAVRRGHVLRSFVRVIGSGVAVGAVIVAVAVVAVPRFIEAISLVISSIDVTSEVGQQYKGDLRLAEWDNMVQNLGPGVTPSWAFGRGVGTYWQEIVPMGLSLDVGSTAFTEGQLEGGGRVGGRVSISRGSRSCTGSGWWVPL